MKKAQRQRMETQILQHGNSLIAAFGLPKTTDARKLSSTLHMLEGKAERAALAWCNGAIDETAFDAAIAPILRRLDQLLGKNDHVILNTDPRGYALKLDEAFARQHGIHRDFGGYGILAPNFTPKSDEV